MRTRGSSNRSEVMGRAPIWGLLLRFSGQAALADQDIAYFLISPPGIISLVLISSILISILATEQASFMIISAATRRGRQISALEALSLTVGHTRRILSFTLRLVARVLLLTLPFLAVSALAAWFLITDYDINYYLAEKPPVFLGTALIIAVLLLVMLVLLVVLVGTITSAQAQGLKVFISVDMEGITGVVNWEDVSRSGKDYDYFRRIMTLETNAAIEGALAAGATDIVVRDSHGSARNILPELLNQRVRLLRDWSGGPLSMMEGIDETFDAVIFIGYHAKEALQGIERD